MPGQPGRHQGSFVSGELADTLEARRDLKYYTSGLKRAANCVPLPQGPLRQRDYTRQVSRLRRLLEAVPMGGATLAAPAGGTAANAIDGNAATRVTSGSISGAGPHELLTVDFHTPTAVSAVDVAPFKAAAAGRISVEYWDGTGWQVLNADRALRTSDRARRFCAPPAAPVSANVWRIVARNLAAAGTVELGEVKFWREGASFGAARLRTFAYSREEAYDLVLTGGHVDVFAAAGGFLTGFAIPHASAEIGGTRWRQQLNTGLIFHPQRAPWRVFREGADLEWQSGAAPIANIPDHDFGDVDYTNGLPAIWQLEWVNWTADSVYAVTVDGEETDGLQHYVLDTDNARLRNALEALPNINPGVAVEVVAGNWKLRKITFSGAGNEGQITINSTRVLNKADAAVAWSRLQKGKEGGEPIWSDARGWPRCGIFYQLRLVLGGSKGTPNAFVPSVTGEYYNFSTEYTSANGAFVAPIDTEGAETIEEMLSSRALLIFTTGGEYWLADPVLSKSQAPRVAKASDHGVREGVPVVSDGDGAIFAAKEGSTLIRFRYAEVEQTYTTERLSVLATHLCKDVSDLARKRASSDTDSSLILFTQADGQMRLVSVLAEQEAKGFARVETDGKVLAVSVNEQARISIVTERQVAGQPVQFLERFEEGLLLDQAVTRTYETPTAEITDLVDHDDAEVWAIADDEIYGPAVVIARAITLPKPATTVTVGRWMPMEAETLPPSREREPGIVTESEAGFHTVRLSLKDTTSVAVGANGLPARWDVPLIDYGGVPSVPSLQAPFTGKRVVENLTGQSLDPTILVTQLRPGRLTLRAIVGEGV